MQVEARLRAFAAVARRRSFSEAAAELYVSQPAVSKHVAALEAELGTQLVVRGGRETSLTPAGELLADYVLRAEALLANGRRALEAAAGEAVGTLSVAASGIPGTYLVPDVLARFHEQHPRVELDFHLDTSAGTLELVRGHRVEVGVVGGMIVPPELEAEPLLEDDVVLVGPPALGGRRLRPRDLEGLTWLSREEGSATRAAVEAARWQMGLHDVRSLELPSWEIVKLAVAHGAGIAAVSRVALELELQTGALAVLDVPGWRLRRTISLVTARGVPLTDAAQRFVELLREAFAPRVEPTPNSNLPRLAPLVGRAHEVAEVARVLSGERLVTLTGAGGSGKTRLALAAAAASVDAFPDGVYLVELAPVADPELVPATVAHVLGVGVDELDARLRGRRILLLLDNFEHVQGAATWLAELLAAVDGPTALATSRAPLRVKRERELAVAPLAAPDAVRLFGERAPVAVGDDPAVAAICARLDGLPLAIELAAARTSVLAPRELLERLERDLGALGEAPRDAPARQRTLDATIEWSERLLGAEARRLFARLGVFRGGWTVDAAEAVCGAGLDTLAALVDQSLIRREGERMTMLETVRAVAVARLEASGERDEIARGHARFFAQLARTASLHARGPQERQWLERVQVDVDNLRAALAWTIEDRDAPLGLEIADALEPFWVRRHNHVEGLRWLEPLLALGGDVDRALRAGALSLAGRLSFELGDVDAAAPHYEESITLARESGDDERIAWALHGLGTIAAKRGEADAARTYFTESAARFERIGRFGPMAGRLTFLAGIEYEAGNIDEVVALFQRARDGFRRAGDHDGVAIAVASLSEVALEAGDVDSALALAREALEAARTSGSQYAVTQCLAGVAAAYAAAGRRDDAARLWGAVERREDDAAVLIQDRELLVGFLGPLDDARIAEGRALSDDESVALAAVSSPA
ncbi:MAG TPA: LysR substrate-binding domain-containing protein [Gaiellaceae bacterium]